MHRFITEYWQRPIAVNDLGWPSYENNNYVLDIWGLGSIEVIKLKALYPDSWLEHLLRLKPVPAAIIYKRIFENEIPENWVAIAEMELLCRKVTAADSKITFYLIDAKQQQVFKQALEAFQKTLPKHAKLVFMPAQQSN